VAHLVEHTQRRFSFNSTWNGKLLVLVQCKLRIIYWGVDLGSGSAAALMVLLLEFCPRRSNQGAIESCLKSRYSRWSASGARLAPYMLTIKPALCWQNTHHFPWRATRKSRLMTKSLVSILSFKSPSQCSVINRHEALDAEFLRERRANHIGPDFCVVTS